MKDENNIEEFFKNRLEREKEFDFREEDWEKIESQLSALPPANNSVLANLSTTTKTLLITVAGIFLIMVGWFGKSTFDSMDDTNEPITQNISPDIEMGLDKDENVEKKDSSIEKINTTSGLSNPTTETNVDETGEKAVAQIATNENLSESAQRLITSVQPPIMVSAATEEAVAEGQTPQSIDSDSPNPFTKIPQESTAANYGISEESQSNLDPFVLTRKGLNLIAWSPPTTPFLLQQNKAVELSKVTQPQSSSSEKLNEEEGIQSKKRATSGTSKWLFGLSIAPESNSIGSPDLANWNAQYGFEIGYKLAPKITLLTGTQYSRKTYKTGGENYSPSNNYWKQNTNGVIPDLIDAQYSVIDIPLQLKFTRNPASRIRFSTTAGMSSYFVLSETNGFQFKDSNPGAANGWSTKESNDYFLGLMNASIGLDWNLSENLVVQLAPYVRIPFKKIGFGNVPMFSSGSTISIQYHLNRRRKANQNFSK